MSAEGWREQIEFAGVEFAKKSFVEVASVGVACMAAGRASD